MAQGKRRLYGGNKTKRGERKWRVSRASANGKCFSDSLSSHGVSLLDDDAAAPGDERGRRETAWGGGKIYLGRGYTFTCTEEYEREEEEEKRE